MRTTWLSLHSPMEWLMGIDVELAFANGRGASLAPTCQFRLDEGKGAVACPIALAAATVCQVLPDRWFSPHFAVCTDFSSPLWPACWIQCPDRFRQSSSRAVQNTWDVYIQELSYVPVGVRELLWAACSSEDVGASWKLRALMLLAPRGKPEHGAFVVSPALIQEPPAP